MRRAIALLLFFVAIAFVFYRKAGRLWWTYDSPLLLHRAIARKWTEEYWTADLQQYLFTPLLNSTYEGFLTLFGLEASRWYFAQIVLIGFVAAAICGALRLYIGTTYAVAGAALFLIGPAVASTAATLYLIHYFESILFGTLATIFFVLAVRRDRLALSVASAFCYVLAVCAKEIAVPLPAVLLCLPDGSLRMRVKHLAAPAVVLGTYAIWRLFVIRLPFGGYGWALTAQDVVTAPWRLLVAAAGAAPAIGFFAIAVMAIAAAPVLRTRRAAVLAAVAMAGAVLPILPVSAEMQDRFALTFWLWLCCAFAVGVAMWKRPAVAIGAAIVIAVIANRQEWAHEFRRNKQMSEEARVWTGERGDVLLRNPAIPSGTMPELAWLKEVHLNREKGARWFYDDIYLCTHPLEGRRVLEYDARTDRVEEVKIAPARFCDSIRTGAPMTADFEYRRKVLHWRFGPYSEGTWRLVLLDGEHAWDMPRESAYRLGETRQLALRVAYRSPAGWVTYSPQLALDFTRQSRTTWRR